MVGDYTTMGLVTKITKNGVIFNAGNEIDFSHRQMLNVNPFAGLKKISKAAYTKQEKESKAARQAGMKDFSNRFKLD